MERPFQAYEGEEPFVFVCYAHDDKAVVYPEITRLKGSGFNIWYDEGIAPGSEWSDTLANHIKGCAAFLYFVTPRSVVSEHCRREVSFALEQPCGMLAAHLEPTELPSGLQLTLSNRQAILKYDEPPAVYEAKLASAIRAEHHDVQESATSTLVLGDWALDVGTRRLTRGEETHELDPKALSVLLHLVDRAPEVVSREGLIDRTWPDVVVGENVLDQAITQLRRALGDDARNPRYIETLPRRGYRLVAPLATVYIGVPASASAGTDSVMESLAVLPFVNMSSDPEQEYFVDGITEDLIDRLSRHSSLRVIARTSSFYFKDRTADVRDIGTRLGVTHLVEGSVRRVGKKVRITAQLVRTDDGGHAWSAQYDRELDDVFALQDEITQEVTRELTDRLIEPAITYQPTPEVYDEYLRGQTWLRRYSYSGAKRARSFFDRAIEADPEYAEAYVAAAKASLVERAFTADNVLELLDRAADYVDKALALDDSLASAQLQKALILLARDFDIQGALDLLHDVFNREPDTYEALNSAISIYQYADRWDLAEEATSKIIQIDPVGITGYVGLSFICLAQGRLDEAQNAMEVVLAIEPEHNLTRQNLLYVMAQRGRIDKALAFIENHGMQNYPMACFVYAAAGQRGEIERVIAEAETRSGLKIWLAHCYALLGDINGVLLSLKKAIDNHDPVLFHLIGHGAYHDCVDIDGVKLGTIYDGEEVQALLREIGFDQESIRRLTI